MAVALCPLLRAADSVRSRLRRFVNLCKESRHFALLDTTLEVPQFRPTKQRYFAPGAPSRRAGYGEHDARCFQSSARWKVPADDGARVRYSVARGIGLVSAIAGFVGLDGRAASANDVDRMIESVSHRGPDGRRVWIEGEIGLGHCMLHTTPESLTEYLPLRRGDLAITADARLDNRAELMRALGSGGSTEPVSDSELILEAYLRWGEDCPRHLLGDFVFAIWDSARRKLFCARDHFGVRPFYYYHQPGRRLVFGSEIKSILALADIPRHLNEAKIADYMLASFEDKARTFYLDINRLPPASTLTVAAGGVRIRQYWALEPGREIRLKSDDEYAEAYRGHFVEAVRCRLRSAFPVGSMLSGGLDSSSIACVANELLRSGDRDALHTFSIVFERVKKSDERPFIESVLAGRRFISHLIDGDSVTPFDDLDSVIWYQDEPFCAPNLSLTRSGWKAAQGAGVRILMDGVFGDNVVSHGLEHLRWLASRWRLLSLSRELRALNDKSEHTGMHWNSVGWFVVNFGLKPYLPQAGLNAWRNLRHLPTDAVVAQSAIFEAGYRDRNHLQQRLRGPSRRVPKASREVHHESLVSGLIETALEVHSHGCGEFRLESRFPFLDKRLVEFCLAIPGEQKVNQGYTRAVVRRALSDYLPDAVRLRVGKGNLGWSFKAGLRSRSDLIERTFEQSAPFLGRYFDAARIRDLRDRCRRGTLRDSDLLELFPAVVLSAWHARAASRLAA